MIRRGAGRVLYSIVCGAPLAGDVGQLVRLAQADGWRVCVIATPFARRFLDVPALTALTGHPVRSEYKDPRAPDLLPRPDALLVAPATANTINKWRAGIADTLALGLLVEGLGRGLPIVAAPFTNSAMAAHPAFGESLARLRDWGVTVMFGTDTVPPHAPGEADHRGFPWARLVAALATTQPTPPLVPLAW